MITALNVFEEVRFIVELVVAEQMFAWSFAQKKRRFLLKSVVGNILLLLMAIGNLYFRMYLNQFDNKIVMQATATASYVFMLFVTLVHLWLCYRISISDTIFIGIAGYAAQHIEYIMVNEVLVFGIYPDILQNLPLYIGICALTCTLLYFFIIRLFARKLHDCDGRLFDDTVSSWFFFMMMLVLLMVSSFMSQNLFMNGRSDYQKVNYLGATVDFISCVLILGIQFSVFKISTLSREKEIIRQLLYERQKQYDLSRENIEIINHKCHDMKHQIQALKEAKAEELDQYIDEVENSIDIYDTVVKTKNEVINTILSEKGLYCEEHNIRLTCIADATHMDFMSTIDLYALIGNALDNAIECVRKYEDKEKRTISLNISANGGFLCIQTNNYVEKQVTFQEGLPVTTKKNRSYHGFGMRSMKHLAEKYGGTLTAEVKDNIFTLQIVLPMPKEFMRLLNKEKVNQELYGK